MEDKELVEKAKQGDKNAFGLLYHKYFQKIFRYCKFNTKNEELAQDICQETFVKAYKKLSGFKTDGRWSIQAYLFTIARNLIIDHSRRKKETSIEEIEYLESSENLYDNFEKKENIKRMQTVLNKLEEADRQIVLLRYFEEMSFSDVAKIIGIKESALRVRTFRVMQKIKDLYEALYGSKN